MGGGRVAKGHKIVVVAPFENLLHPRQQTLVFPSSSLLLLGLENSGVND